MAGGIVAGSAPDPGTITMVRPNQAYNKDDLFLMKLSQIVMMGIGFLSIWYGVFAVAFDDEATNQNFLVLFVGGLLSFAVSIGPLNFKARRTGTVCRTSKTTSSASPFSSQPSVCFGVRDS